MIMLMINGTLKKLLDGQGIPTVPYLGSFDNVYDMVKSNEEWMINGKGEGIILVTQGMQISKWKIGTERNYSNVEAIQNL